jgi:heme oxygenase
MLTEILKKETRKEHTNTEASMGAKSIFSDDYTIQLYYQHLQQLLKIHSTAHLIFNTCLDLIPNKKWIPENRSSDMMEDLKAIDSTFKIPHLTLKENHGFTNLPALIGLMYVIKGSELGGNIIATKIEAHNKHWHLPQVRFYKHIEPTLLKEGWLEWCNKINEISADNDFIYKTVDGAKNAFYMCTHPEQFIISRISL